jgi:hypothetical protein
VESGGFTGSAAIRDVSVSAGVNTGTSLGLDGGSVLILVVDSQNPHIVYAATAGGLFASTDGAGTWKAMSPLPAGSGAVISLVVDPQNSGTVYAAALPGESDGDAVFKSTDEDNVAAVTITVGVQTFRPIGRRSTKLERDLLREL